MIGLEALLGLQVIDSFFQQVPPKQEQVFAASGRPISTHIVCFHIITCLHNSQARAKHKHVRYDV